MGRAPHHSRLLAQARCRPGRIPRGFWRRYARDSACVGWHTEHARRTHSVCTEDVTAGQSAQCSMHPSSSVQSDPTHYAPAFLPLTVLYHNRMQAALCWQSDQRRIELTGTGPETPHGTEFREIEYQLALASPPCASAHRYSGPEPHRRQPTLSTVGATSSGRSRQLEPLLVAPTVELTDCGCGRGMRYGTSASPARDQRA